MNRSKETFVTAINASFYKNVYLLTQMVPPSLEFQQHFKKGMFDKPNTTGFLHVFHYLSVIYDAKLFKQMIKWPILCRKDEIMQRNGIKNFLSILSRDNPDINFPSILMTYLIRSGGTKFLIIIWKLSQLVLRVYIKRHFRKELLNTPCTSLIDNLTMEYFNSTTAKRCSLAREFHKETKGILDITNNFINNEIEILKMYKSEIFDRKENIKKLITDTPFHPLVKEQLMDIEDLNVINMWKRNISEGLQYVHTKNKELNELEVSCNHLCKVLRINSNPVILDANEFPKISSDNHLLITQPETQHLINNLYVNGPILFSTLLSLLSLASEQMLYHIKTADSFYLPQCLLCIQQAHTRIECMQMLFVALEKRILNILMNEQSVYEEIKNIYTSFHMDNILKLNRDTFLQSPKINLNFKQFTDNLFYEKLCLSPIEGKHKHLFKRYKDKYYPVYELPTIASSSDSLWNNINRRLSFHKNLSNNKHKQVTPYRKSFSYSNLYSKRSRENILRSPNLIYEKLRPNKRHCSIQLTVNNYTERTTKNKLF